MKEDKRTTLSAEEEMNRLKEEHPTKEKSPDLPDEDANKQTKKPSRSQVKNALQRIYGRAKNDTTWKLQQLVDETGFEGQEIALAWHELADQKKVKSYQFLKP